MTPHNRSWCEFLKIIKNHGPKNTPPSCNLGPKFYPQAGHFLKEKCWLSCPVWRCPCLITDSFSILQKICHKLSRYFSPKEKKFRISHRGTLAHMLTYLENLSKIKVILTKNFPFITVIYNAKSQFVKISRSMKKMWFFEIESI